MSNYPPRQEAIISSLTQFMHDHPDVPMCGLGWRAAFAAGEAWARAGENQPPQPPMDELRGV